MKVLRGVVLSLVVLGVGCGSPTGPPSTTPTPTPTPNTSACAGELKPMTGFTANPTTITEGDAFTLSWAAPCGLVSLAQKGSPQFLQGQPSTGSYELKPGANGYPTAPGETVYEATNGDLGKRLDVTVTVIAKATPTPTPAPAPDKPTITLAGADSCYPFKGPGCDVAITATARNYDSIAWSGCCAGSSGTTGSCHVSTPSATPVTCTAKVTGPGGSAQADKPVTGTNVAPVISSRWRSSGSGDCDTFVDFEFTITDEDGAYMCPGLNVWNGCTEESSECPVSGWPKLVRVRAHIDPAPHAAVLCYVRFRVRDEWGLESAEGGYETVANACP